MDVTDRADANINIDSNYLDEKNFNGTEEEEFLQGLFNAFSNCNQANNNDQNTGSCPYVYEEKESLLSSDLETSETIQTLKLQIKELKDKNLAQECELKNYEEQLSEKMSDLLKMQLERNALKQSLEIAETEKSNIVLKFAEKEAELQQFKELVQKYTADGNQMQVLKKERADEVKLRTKTEKENNRISNLLSEKTTALKRLQASNKKVVTTLMLFGSILKEKALLSTKQLRYLKTIEDEQLKVNFVTNGEINEHDLSDTEDGGLDACHINIPSNGEAITKEKSTYSPVTSHPIQNGFDSCPENSNQNHQFVVPSSAIACQKNEILSNKTPNLILPSFKPITPSTDPFFIGKKSESVCSEDFMDVTDEDIALMKIPSRKQYLVLPSPVSPMPCTPPPKFFNRDNKSVIKSECISPKPAIPSEKSSFVAKSELPAASNEKRSKLFHQTSDGFEPALEAPDPYRTVFQDTVSTHNSVVNSSQTLTPDLCYISSQQINKTLFITNVGGCDLDYLVNFNSGHSAFAITPNDTQMSSVNVNGASYSENTLSPFQKASERLQHVYSYYKSTEKHIPPKQGNKIYIPNTETHSHFRPVTANSDDGYVSNTQISAPFTASPTKHPVPDDSAFIASHKNDNFHHEERNSNNVSDSNICEPLHKKKLNKESYSEKSIDVSKLPCESIELDFNYNMPQPKKKILRVQSSNKKDVKPSLDSNNNSQMASKPTITDENVKNVETNTMEQSDVLLPNEIQQKSSKKCLGSSENDTNKKKLRKRKLKTKALDENVSTEKINSNDMDLKSGDTADVFNNKGSSKEAFNMFGTVNANEFNMKEIDNRSLTLPTCSEADKYAVSASKKPCLSSSITNEPNTFLIKTEVHCSSNIERDVCKSPVPKLLANKMNSVSDLSGENEVIEAVQNSLPSAILQASPLSNAITHSQSIGSLKSGLDHVQTPMKTHVKYAVSASKKPCLSSSITNEPNTFLIKTEVHCSSNIERDVCKSPVPILLANKMNSVSDLSGENEVIEAVQNSLPSAILQASPLSNAITRSQSIGSLKNGLDHVQTPMKTFVKSAVSASNTQISAVFTTSPTNHPVQDGSAFIASHRNDNFHEERNSSGTGIINQSFVPSASNNVSSIKLQRSITFSDSDLVDSDRKKEFSTFVKPVVVNKKVCVKEEITSPPKTVNEEISCSNTNFSVHRVNDKNISLSSDESICNRLGISKLPVDYLSSTPCITQDTSSKPFTLIGTETHKLPASLLRKILVEKDAKDKADSKSTLLPELDHTYTAGSVTQVASSHIFHSKSETFSKDLLNENKPNDILNTNESANNNNNSMNGNGLSLLKVTNPKVSNRKKRKNLSKRSRLKQFGKGKTSVLNINHKKFTSFGIKFIASSEDNKPVQEHNLDSESSKMKVLNAIDLGTEINSNSQVDLKSNVSDPNIGEPSHKKKLNEESYSNSEKSIDVSKLPCESSELDFNYNIPQPKKRISRVQSSNKKDVKPSLDSNNNSQMASKPTLTDENVKNVETNTMEQLDVLLPNKIQQKSSKKYLGSSEKDINKKKFRKRKLETKALDSDLGENVSTEKIKSMGLESGDTADVFNNKGSSKEAFNMFGTVNANEFNMKEIDNRSLTHPTCSGADKYAVSASKKPCLSSSITNEPNTFLIKTEVHCSSNIERDVCKSPVPKLLANKMNSVSDLSGENEVIEAIQNSLPSTILQTRPLSNVITHSQSIGSLKNGLDHVQTPMKTHVRLYSVRNKSEQAENCSFNNVFSYNGESSPLNSGLQHLNSLPPHVTSVNMHASESDHLNVNVSFNGQNGHPNLNKRYELFSDVALDKELAYELSSDVALDKDAAYELFGDVALVKEPANGKTDSFLSSLSEDEHPLVIVEEATEPPEENAKEVIDKPLPHKKKSKSKKKKNCGTVKYSDKILPKDSPEEINTGLTISKAFEELEKLQFDESHFKLRVHTLVNALINPSNAPDTTSLVVKVCNFLKGSRRNPFLSFSINHDAMFLPQLEKCLVLSLIQVDHKMKNHLNKLISSTIHSLYLLVLAKDSIPIYGLCAFCRVLTELCKCIKDKKKPLKLCCDLLKMKHKFAPYLIASIISVWPEICAVPDHPTDIELSFLKSIAYGVSKKPKTLTDMQWKHCTPIFSRFLTAPAIVDVTEDANNLVETIKSILEEEPCAEEYMLIDPLIIFCGHEDWKWVQETLLDFFVIPSLSHYALQEQNKRAFVLFCDILSEIGLISPDFTKEVELLRDYFFLKDAFDYVKQSAAYSLLKHFLLKKKILPDYLTDWIGENQSKYTDSPTKLLVYRRMMSDSPELTENDVIPPEIV